MLSPIDKSRSSLIIVLVGRWTICLALSYLSCTFSMSLGYQRINLSQLRLKVKDLGSQKFTITSFLFHYHPFVLMTIRTLFFQSPRWLSFLYCCSATWMTLWYLIWVCLFVICLSDLGLFDYLVLHRLLLGGLALALGHLVLVLSHIGHSRLARDMSWGWHSTWFLVDSSVLLMELQILLPIYQTKFWNVLWWPKFAGLRTRWPGFVRKMNFCLVGLLQTSIDQRSILWLYVIQIIFRELMVRLEILSILCRIRNILHARLCHALLCHRSEVHTRDFIALARLHSGNLLLAWTDSFINQSISGKATHFLYFMFWIISCVVNCLALPLLELKFV